MSAWSAVYGIVARDLARTTRQTSRLLGGVARPFMWLVLIGTGYGAITRLEQGMPYQAFVFPGIVVMAALFGGTLTAISTVYDREFGMLRLMLASPAGVPAVLAGHRPHRLRQGGGAGADGRAGDPRPDRSRPGQRHGRGLRLRSHGGVCAREQRVLDVMGVR